MRVKFWGVRWAARVRMRPGRRLSPPAALAVAGSGTLLVLLVFAAVVSTAAPTVRALHGGTGGQTWALSGMSLGLAAGLLSIGALADHHGRRRVFVLSCLGMLLASTLAALAPNLGVFVAARVLQGLAGAGLLAASLGLIGHAFVQGPARTHATGVWGAMVGAGTALGPAVSALLALSGSWRTGYWFQALAAAALLPPARRLPESRAANPRPIDLAGAATFAVAMTCLTAAVTLGRESWTQPATPALAAGALCALILFRGVERGRTTPMVELELLRRPLFVAASVGALFTGLAVVALVSTLPSFLERAFGQTPLACAGLLGVFSVTGTLVAYHGRRLPAALGSSHRLVAGLLCGAAGLAAVGGLNAHSSPWRLVPGLLALGVGYGLINAALGRLAVESVPLDRASMGSGANNTARYVGGAVGVAIVAALISAGADRPGRLGLVHGWNLASAVVAVICALAAGAVWSCARQSGDPRREALGEERLDPDREALKRRRPHARSDTRSLTPGRAHDRWSDGRAGARRPEADHRSDL